MSSRCLGPARRIGQGPGQLGGGHRRLAGGTGRWGLPGHLRRPLLVVRHCRRIDHPSGGGVSSDRTNLCRTPVMFPRSGGQTQMVCRMPPLPGAYRMVARPSRHGRSRVRLRHRWSGHHGRLLAARAALREHGSRVPAAARRAVWGRAFTQLCKANGVLPGGKGGRLRKGEKPATVAGLAQQCGVSERTARNRVKAARRGSSLPARVRARDLPDDDSACSGRIEPV